MNRDVLEGKWKQIQGEVKVWWARLTHDDLGYAAGKLEVFSGLLQERYGYTRQLSVEKISKRMTKYEGSPKNKNELTPGK